MTDEQFKRMDERFDQIARLLLVIACNTARNPVMLASEQSTGMRAAEAVVNSVKPLGGAQ